MLTLHALRIRQRDTNLFITAIKGGELLRMMEPSSGQGRMAADIWKKEDNPDGYQRIPEEKRIRSISNFLLGKRGVRPLLPQSIILNLRSRASEFKPLLKGFDPPFGILRIKDEAGALWEVDGQHRLRGLCDAVKRHEKLREYYLPVTIVSNLSRPDEALEFVAINTTQVKVKPDLVLRILWSQYRDQAKAAESFLGTDIWKIKAVNIVDALEKDPESPFHGNIALPGTSVSGKITSERTFVDSLEPLSTHEDLLTPKYVGDFWKAIAAVYPKLSEEEMLLESVLFKGVGLYTMHKIAPLIAYYSEAMEGSYQRRSLTKVLRSALLFPSSFWMKRGRARDYNNRRGYNRLSDQVIFDLLSAKPPKVSKKLRARTRLEKEVEALVTLRNYHAFSESTIRSRVKSRDRGAYEGAGTYVLVNLRKLSVYIGMSGIGYGEGLASRLAQHLRKDYDIFNWRRVGTASMASLIETSTWHAFKDAKWKLDNRRHPESREYERCPVCGR